MTIADKLSLRAVDYFATVGISNGNFLSEFADGVSGMACVGRFDKNKHEKLKDFKVVDDIRRLDESVFTKVFAKYTEDLSIKNLVHIADNLGLVLIQNVPNNKRPVLIRLLNNKAGIFEIWPVRNNKNGCCDLLFKVRKHGA